jgi:hypothetical protein
MDPTRVNPHLIRTSQNGESTMKKNGRKLRGKAARKAREGTKIKRAPASMPASNGGDSKRKPQSCKAHDSRVIRYNSPKTGNPVKGNADVGDGTFILYGARTKEGQMENRKGYAHEPKAWRQGYDKTAYATGIGMHDATNGVNA